jgi:serine/threonine protein kinase
METSSKDRYEIVGTIGSGATSRVDKARDTVLGRTVALKTLVHAFGAPVEQKQFLREAQIVSQLSHPAIVSLYDVGIEDGNVAFLVMEYISGKTLQQVLSDGPIPFPRACAWAAELAAALGRAHKAGILHGDLKPGNILITDEGNVKLGDFGIARFATQVSSLGRLMGTPAYLSPEQIGGETQTTRSDLFSLGIVLYQMLTGVAPFQGSSVSAVCAQILSAEPAPPSQRNPALPKEIDHIVLRCLAKSPADRYPSADAFAASLYPFARNTWQPAASTASSANDTRTAERAKSSWFTRPFQPQDLWIAAAIVLAVGCIPIVRGVRSRFRMLALPVMASIAPKAPVDLLGRCDTNVPIDTTAELGDSASGSESLEPPPTPPEQKAGARRVKTSITQRGPSRVAPPPARNVNAAAPLSAPEISSPLASPFPKVSDRAALRIEIESTVNDGTLAIFADQNVLFTTDLHVGTADKPTRLERALTAGPHQLRVALYRSDKNLQLMKEGLGDIRADSSNVLRVRVTARSVLLVRHSRSLEVIWPSAVAPSSGGPTSGTNIAAR